MPWRGVVKNDAEAVKWYRQAAEQGDAMAQGMLGLMYMHGEGVAQNDEEAVRWMFKATEQGDAMAQYHLGTMYGEGRGVAKNEKEELKWVFKAAEQGNILAQITLDLDLRSAVTNGETEKAKEISNGITKRQSGEMQSYNMRLAGCIVRVWVLLKATTKRLNGYVKRQNRDTQLHNGSLGRCI